MKIKSRPTVEQRCAPIVEEALTRLRQGAWMNGLGNPVSLDQDEREVRLVMGTLRSAGAITDYKVDSPRETKASTAGQSEWLIRVKFTDDPTLKTGYVADLLFQYRHQT